MSKTPGTMAQCTTCGGQIPENSPGGWCPACVFRRMGQFDPPPGEPVVGDDDGPEVLPTRARLGDYELDELIAHGGMGVVHQARQLGLHRRVALKLLLGGQYAGEEARERFRHEARAAAGLSHPGIVPVYDVGEHEGQLFFSMELVLGATGKPAPTLKDLVRAGPLSPERAVGYVVQVSHAVAYAHAQGILHRDLKPANVLVDAMDRARVSDFGLSRPIERSAQHTVTGQILGSPGYLSPEQVVRKFGTVGVRSDVYALGAILYFLLTGRPPVDSKDQGVEDLQRAAEQEPIPPRTLNPALPRDLEVICLRCLAKEPGRRYADANAVADDLGRWQRGEPILGRPVLLPERLWYRLKRKPVIASLVAGLVCTLALGVASSLGLLWQNLDQSEVVKQGQVADVLREVAQDVAADRAPDALRLLARHMREQSPPRALSDRFIQLINERSFLVPVGSAVQTGEVGTSETFTKTVARSDDGLWVAEVTNIVDVVIRGTGPGGTARHWTRAHPKVIRSLSFSHDGNWLVSSSADHTGQVWNVQTGERRRSLPHSAPVYDAVFHPGGGWIATGCSDGSVHVWPVEGSAIAPETALFAFRQGAVNAVRFSPDGRLLAAGTDTGTVRVWDLEKGTWMAEAREFGDAVIDMVFPVDAAELRVRLEEGGVRALRLTEPNPLAYVRRVLPPARVGPQAEPAPVALLEQLEQWGQLGQLGQRGVKTSRLSRDRRTLAVAIEAEVRLFDPGPPAHLLGALAHRDHVIVLAFNSNATRLATATRAGRIRVWDVAARQPVTEEWTVSRPVRTLVFDVEDRVLMSDDDRQFWDLAVSPQPLPAWLPDLAEVLVGSTTKPRAQVRLDLPRQEVLARFESRSGGAELDRWAARLLFLDAQPEGRP